MLEFALKEFDYSIPLGRCEYFYLEPMSFTEFLQASPKKHLLDHIENFSFGEGIPKPIHTSLLESFSEYCMVGGMPAVVKTWFTTSDWDAVQKKQSNLLTSLIEDLAKHRIAVK